MTTPAMPELPEPELGYIETDKSRQPAFSARQMRAAMQAQPAAVGVSDVLTAFDEAVARELPRVSHVEYNSHEICKHFAEKVRAILALRPQAVPMTLEPTNDVGLVPVVIKPFTPAQRRRLWDNSPEIHKDAASITGFERIVSLTESAHGITAQAKEGGA